MAAVEPPKKGHFGNEPFVLCSGLSFVQGYPLLVYDSNFMCECTLDKCLRYCYSLVKLYCSYGFYISMFRNVKLCAPLLLYNVHASYYYFVQLFSCLPVLN